MWQEEGLARIKEVEITIRNNFGKTRMSQPFISIRRQPYEEPYHLNLVISASNGVLIGSLEYYCSAGDLEKVGSKLAAFPERVGDSYFYKLGSPRPEDRFAFHLVLCL